MEAVILSDKIKQIFNKPDIGKKFVLEILSMGHPNAGKEEQTTSTETVKEEQDGSYTLQVDGHTFTVTNAAMLDKDNS